MRERTTDVVIVGAGPTGLSLACQLARWGVDFVVIDKNAGVTPYSKAIGVQARTLEIYEQLGIAGRAVAEGTKAEGVRLLVAGAVRGELALGDIGKGLSPYPFVLMLEQSKNERLLYDWLRHAGHDVRWGSVMEQVTQSEEGAVVTVRNPDGSTSTIDARYVVGCDGARSPMRHALGIPFEGSTFERTFYVADAHIDWALSHDVFHAALGPETFVLFFPLKGDGRYRIVGVFPEDYAGKDGEIVYAEIERRVLSETQVAMDIRDVEWFSTYKVHTRHARAFRQGRCLLAGDAAHIHTPAGAQGMNTGIQDAYNLAWKLALVLRGGASDALLDTYDEERLANARHLLETTDRLFALIASPARALAFLRLHVMPRLAPHLLRMDTVKAFVFPLLSQIGIAYPDSALSARAGGDGRDGFAVRSGERLPWVEADGRSIYDTLHVPAFHCLVFVPSLERGEEPVALRAGPGEPTSSEARVPVIVRRHALTPEVAQVFGATDTFSVLVRPDNYIAAIFRGDDVARVHHYLHSHLATASP